MGQVTIYLDDDSETRARSFAKTQGLPVSRWIAELIRERTADEWPSDIRDLAGAWDDFPELRKLKEGSVPDCERESL